MPQNEEVGDSDHGGPVTLTVAEGQGNRTSHHVSTPVEKNGK